MQIDRTILLYAIIVLMVIALLLPVIAYVFQIAFTTRLLAPLLYLALMYTVFSGWRQANEQAYEIGFVVILLVSIGSWIPELRQMLKERRVTNSGEIYRKWQIEKAEEKGIDITNSTFDKNDNLIDKTTGEKLVEFDEHKD